jgi:hypothetical protein
VGEQPVSTTDETAWDTGCQHHNNYERVNGNTLGHFENSMSAGYTVDGSTAGPDSVLAEYYSTGGPTSEPNLLPQPVWDGAVFHRAALLEPRLANIGFNSSTFDESGTYYTFVCLWGERGGHTALWRRPAGDRQLAHDLESDPVPLARQRRDQRPDEVPGLREP